MWVSEQRWLGNHDAMVKGREGARLLATKMVRVFQLFVTPAGPRATGDGCFAKG